MSTKLVVYCDNCTNYRHYNMTPSTGYGAVANAKREGWYIDDDGDALCPTCNMRQHGEEPGQAFTARARLVSQAAEADVREDDERDVIAKQGTPEQKRAYGI